MNTGVISKRYAKAIFRFASDKGKETRLREEMKALSDQFVAVPALKKVLDDPTVPAVEKKKVLITAAGKNASDVYQRVVEMVVANGREHQMLSIALMYDKVYRKEKNMVVIQLTTVEPADQEMKEELIRLVIKDKAEKPDFAAKTDPDIIGGFVLGVDDLRLDASVRNQLNQLRLELTK
jgi:F-type H+-transporting ATPase subunit delta